MTRLALSSNTCNSAVPKWVLMCVSAANSSPLFRGGVVASGGLATAFGAALEISGAALFFIV